MESKKTKEMTKEQELVKLYTIRTGLSIIAEKNETIRSCQSMICLREKMKQDGNIVNDNLRDEIDIYRHAHRHFLAIVNQCQQSLESAYSYKSSMLFFVIAFVASMAVLLLVFLNYVEELGDVAVEILVFSLSIVLGCLSKSLSTIIIRKRKVGKAAKELITAQKELNKVKNYNVCFDVYNLKNMIQELESSNICYENVILSEAHYSKGIWQVISQISQDVIDEEDWERIDFVINNLTNNGVSSIEKALLIAYQKNNTARFYEDMYKGGRLVYQLASIQPEPIRTFVLQEFAPYFNEKELTMIKKLYVTNSKYTSEILVEELKYNKEFWN